MKTESMANMKGNLGLRSSPLCPTSSKLTSQYLVIDHMTNHFNKISKAKSAIDNKPPKSLVTSQKKRDQRSREQVKRGGPMKATYAYSRSHSVAEGDIYDETLWDEPQDEQERQVMNVMRATLTRPAQSSVDATYGSEAPASNLHHLQRPMSASGMATTYPEYQRRPLSSRSTRSLASNVSRASLGATMHKKTYDGDLLQTRSHVFTEPAKPFTPRTLKSTRESRLKSSGCYNPPPKKQTERKELNQTVTMNAPESDGRGDRPKPAARKRQTQVPEDSLTETAVMFESLQTRDMRHFQDKSNQNNVPPLEITMDTDHMKWIQEQADKAELRSRSSRKNMHHISEEESAGSTLNQDTQQSTLFGSKSLLRSRMHETEEEQKYVQFAQEVTQDVLNRGIFSDSVLNQVFESHIERRKKQLDARRLRAIVEQLRRDLGLGESTKDVYYGRLSSGSAGDRGMLTATRGRIGSVESSASRRDSLRSANSLGFGSVGPTPLSTVHLAPDELSATQALAHYQMDISTQEARAELDKSDQEQNEEVLLAEQNGEVEEVSVSSAILPQVKPRRRRGVHATTVATVEAEAAPSDGEGKDGQKNGLNEVVEVKEAPSESQESQDVAMETQAETAAKTAPHTEEEAEDNADYEDDYDADEDDQGGTAAPSSDDDF